MKIISKHQDYYDHMAAFGVDEQHVFPRKNDDAFETIEKGRSPAFMDLMTQILSFNRRANRSGFEIGALFFCGQVYTYIQVQGNESQKPVFCYTKEHFQSACAERNLNDSFFSIIHRISITDAIDHFNFQFNQPSTLDVLNQWSHKHKSAYFDFVARGINKSEESNSFKKSIIIELHPPLIDYQFFNIKDGVTAFQEIEQYLFSTLNFSERDMASISDKDMAKAKGHDGAYSFKKAPQKKK